MTMIKYCISVQPQQDKYFMTLKRRNKEIFQPNVNFDNIFQITQKKDFKPRKK